MQHTRAASAGFAMLCALPMFAATAAADAEPTSLQSIVVVASTPLGGSRIDRNKIPANLQSFDTDDLTRQGSTSLLASLRDTAGSVSLNDVLGDPFQPDLSFRGFTASPVLGTPQGVAVYQNGVRINEAFGDTVNWDLIPNIAIAHVDVQSANPLYGLNALGGAANIEMKRGSTMHGVGVELARGSFGTREASLELGGQRVGQRGALSGYVAAHALESRGWRDFSTDRLQQLYASLGAHGDSANIELSYTGARNRLGGQGTAPEQTLHIDRKLTFTTPQRNLDAVDFFTLNGDAAVNAAMALQANLYRRAFAQRVQNGNTSDYVACTGAPVAQLCQADASTPLVATDGAPIPDLSAAGSVFIGQNDREYIDSVATGASLQLNSSADLFGHENRFVVGARIDDTDVRFRSTAEVGVIDAKLRVLPSGYIVDTPQNTGFNATPVRLHARSRSYAWYFTDTFNITPHIALTASGRDNRVNIELRDRLGTNLNGNSHYQRFNAAFGATWQFTPALTAYAGYAESNRVPTPSEIECSDPERPCLLPSSLSADPPRLAQVVAHTLEAGTRGGFDAPMTNGVRVHWSLGAFRTELHHDIYGVATSQSSGYFTNIDATRRQGIEAALLLAHARWSLWGSYSLIDATFRTGFTIASASNPFADDNGHIQVHSGNRLPGVPRQQIKLGLEYAVDDRLSIGALFDWFGAAYLRGDESNQTRPLRSYRVLNLHGRYAFNDALEAFIDLRNALDARYNTFGQLGDPTRVGAPGVPSDAQPNDARVSNRFLSPGLPRSAQIGVRVHL